MTWGRVTVCVMVTSMHTVLSKRSTAASPVMAQWYGMVVLSSFCECGSFLIVMMCRAGVCCVCCLMVQAGLPTSWPQALAPRAYCEVRTPTHGLRAASVGESNEHDKEFYCTQMYLNKFKFLSPGQHAAGRHHRYVWCASQHRQLCVSEQTNASGIASFAIYT